MIPIMFSLMTTMASITWLMMNPMSMGLTILIMSLSTAFLFASYMSSWIAFLLFLIYIGGMLVMFAYFVATSPNMPMNMKWPITFSISTFTLIMMSMKLYSPSHSTNNLFMNTFYSIHSWETLIMLALVLLLTMIIVVKITTSNKGPLRPFNKYV